jgi:hypothetical protein
MFISSYSWVQVSNINHNHLPDPYIRAYLIPDFKRDKKKTKSIHNTINPVYDDLYEKKSQLYLYSIV